MDPMEEKLKPSPIEDLVKEVVEDPDKKVEIEVALTVRFHEINPQKVEEAFCVAVPTDISCINPNIISYELKIAPTINLTAHKRRVLGEENSSMVRKETHASLKRFTSSLESPTNHGK